MQLAKPFLPQKWLRCESGQGSSALLFFILSVSLWGSTKHRLCDIVELVVCFRSKVVVCLTGTWALEVLKVDQVNAIYIQTVFSSIFGAVNSSDPGL